MNTLERLTTNHLAPLLNAQEINYMAITTLQDVKDYLGITDTSQDAKIEALIPYVEQIYLDIRNAPWDVDDMGDVVYPIGSNITAAEMIGYKLKQSSDSEFRIVGSESLGSYSVSYVDTGSTWKGFPASYVSGIKKYIRGV